MVFWLEKKESLIGLGLSRGAQVNTGRIDNGKLAKCNLKILYIGSGKKLSETPLGKNWIDILEFLEARA